MPFEDSGHVGHSFFNAIQENKLMDAADYLTQMLLRRKDDYTENTEAMKTFILSHLVIGFDLAGRLDRLQVGVLEKAVDKEVRRYRTRYSRYPDGVSMMMRSIMRGIMADTGVCVSGTGGRLQDIRHYVQVNYPNPNLSVSSISERFGISMSHLSRLFKKDMGVKLNDYIRTERITRAQALLRDTELSVQEISALVGFNSASAFIRAYRERTGMTPGAYRERNCAEHADDESDPPCIR